MEYGEEAEISSLWKKCFSSRDIQFWPSPPTYPGQTLLINQHSLPTKQEAASESFLGWCSRHPPTINKKWHKRRDLLIIPFIPSYCASGKQYYKLRKKKETSEIEEKTAVSNFLKIYHKRQRISQEIFSGPQVVLRCEFLESVHMQQKENWNSRSGLACCSMLANGLK